MTGKHIIDVSHYQGQIDWEKVKGSIYQGAILKASEGTGLTDAYYKRNRYECRRLGIPSGPYHFYRPNVGYKAQIQHFYDVAGPQQPGDIIPWIDVEWIFSQTAYKGPDTMQNLALAILEAENLFGKPVGIYTSPGAWNPLQVTNHARWAGLPLWVATYGVQAGKPILPKSWTSWAVHQYSSSGTVPGIQGRVDLNYVPDMDEIMVPDNRSSRDILPLLAQVRKTLDEIERLVDAG